MTYFGPAICGAMTAPNEQKITSGRPAMATARSIISMGEGAKAALSAFDHLIRASAPAAAPVAA